MRPLHGQSCGSHAAGHNSPGSSLLCNLIGAVHRLRAAGKQEPSMEEGEVLREVRMAVAIAGARQTAAPDAAVGFAAQRAATAGAICGAVGQRAAGRTRRHQRRGARPPDGAAGGRVMPASMFMYHAGAHAWRQCQSCQGGGKGWMRLSCPKAEAQYAELWGSVELGGITVGDHVRLMVPLEAE